MSGRYASEGIFDFLSFPTLTTDRVVLREPRPNDAAGLFMFRSDPEGQRYNSQPMRDVSEAAALIDELRAGFATRRTLHWVVTIPGEDLAIGLFGFGAWEQFHRRADVGYDLARRYWGRGIATEALGAILRFGFTRLELHRVEAQTIADNHGSVRLLQRLGFQREGTRREYSLEDDGTYHDGAIFGLLRHDFRNGDTCFAGRPTEQGPALG